MDLGLAGKIAISGGGSKGMGKAISLDLAREGCKVIVAARGHEAVDAVVSEINQSGGIAVPAYVDMSTKEGIEQAVRIAKENWGDPDIAVGNIYGPVHGCWEETKDDDFRDAFNMLVMSHIWMLRTVTPAMKEKGWGRIILLNSMAAKEPHKELPLVTANVTRVAAVSLNKSVSNELSPYGITINTIGTGGIATERYTSYMKKTIESQGKDFEEREAERRKEIPVGRLGKPEEISAVVTFLCSERAGYVTGQFILVDGGVVKSLF